MEFKYTTSLTGILRNLYDNDKSYFTTQIKINYSSVLWGTYHTAPLDYEDTRYWVSDFENYKEHFYSFCFSFFHSVKLTEYEMKTSNGQK